MILSKPGTVFSIIAPAGVRIIVALDEVSAKLGYDLTITSACDGLHSGPDDPHHKGEAYDVRTHDIADKGKLLAAIIEKLGTAYFYAFVENPGLPNEHIHIQRKKGTVYVRPA